MKKETSLQDWAGLHGPARHSSRAERPALLWFWPRPMGRPTGLGPNWSRDEIPTHGAITLAIGGGPAVIVLPSTRGSGKGG
jgi:hypothetical protein